MKLRTKKQKVLITISIIIIMLAIIIVFNKYVLSPIMFPEDPRISKVNDLCDYVNNEYKEIVIINSVHFKDYPYPENEKEVGFEFKFLDKTKSGMTEEKSTISYEIRSYIQDYLENHPEHFLITENYKIMLHFYPYYDPSFKLYNMYGQGGLYFYNYSRCCSWKNLNGFKCVSMSDIGEETPIKYISTFKEIEYICAGQCYEEEDLEALSNLPNLKLIRYDYIDEEQLEKVKAVVPEGCEVISDNH